MKITAVIITKDEAEVIGRCLASLQSIADEVIVMDSGSQDDTIAIAAAAGARVVHQPWLGYSAQKNAANALVQEGYILSMDADEELSQGLIQEIKAIKSSLAGKNAWAFPRLNNYCGRWIRYGGYYPDRKIRLFPAGKARWEGEYVHEVLRLDEGVNVLPLRGDLLHYSYVSISDHIIRADRYSTLGAARLHGKPVFVLGAKMLFSPVIRFYRNYLFRLGFLDGFEGFMLTAITSVEVFLKYGKALMRSKGQ